MASKKITVLGDAADESLTPEEEHKIEVRIDKMLDVNQPDESQQVVVKPKAEDAPVAEAIELVEKPKSAPPLPKKNAKKVSIKITEQQADAEPEATPPPPIEHPEPIVATSEKSTTVPVRKTAPEVPKAAPRYRPPDGPMPFKRAEPLTPVKKLPLSGDNLAGVADESAGVEDLAITEASDAKPVRSLITSRRLFMGLVIIVLLAIPVVQPTLRTKGVNFVRDHLSHKTVPPTKTVAAEANPALTQPAVSAQELYVSKQAGIYNVYKADADGQNSQLLLPGTGYETNQLTLVPNGSGDAAALVSVRDSQKDSSGASLQTLTLITVKTGATTVVDYASQFKIIDWFGDRLVYATIKSSTSTTDSSRYRLISYNYKTKQSIVLDHANYLNDVFSASGAIYYAVGGSTGQFIKINPDGAGRQVLLTSEVLSVFRIDYGDLLLVGPTNRYTYKLGKLGTGKPALSSDTYNGMGRLYIDSPDGKQSVYVDSRAGKDTLVLYDKSSQKETVLATQDGLSYPIRWLSNTMLVYRVDSSTETADYGATVNSGETKKIVDVTDANGVALWNYQ